MQLPYILYILSIQQNFHLLEILNKDGKCLYFIATKTQKAFTNHSSMFSWSWLNTVSNPQHPILDILLHRSCTTKSHSVHPNQLLMFAVQIGYHCISNLLKGTFCTQSMNKECRNCFLIWAVDIPETIKQIHRAMRRSVWLSVYRWYVSHSRPWGFQLFSNLQILEMKTVPFSTTTNIALKMFSFVCHSCTWKYCAITSWYM